MDNVIKPFTTIASKTSIEAILNLDSEAFGTEQAWNWDNFVFALPFKMDLSFVAFQNNNIVGYVIASVYDLDNVLTGHVNRIASGKTTKGTGIGTKLLNSVHVKCKKLGLSNITLEFDSALAVLDFYQTFGYCQMTNEDFLIKYLKSKNKLLSKELYFSEKRIVLIKNLSK